MIKKERNPQNCTGGKNIAGLSVANGLDLLRRDLQYYDILQYWELPAILVQGVMLDIFRKLIEICINHSKLLLI